MRVLVTRPRLDAERTAKKLAALGHEAVIDPVIEVEPLKSEIPKGNFDALVFTSSNAVRLAAALDLPKALPTFAVGGRTAEVARELGFQNVHIADGDVVSLGDLIAPMLPRRAKVLHLAGEDRAGDLPGRLAANGISIETNIIYRARPAGQLSPETVVAFRQGKIGAVLHYSARSAEAFVRLARAAQIQREVSEVRQLCLSSAVAAPLKSLCEQAEIAAAPNEEAVLELLGA